MQNIDQQGQCSVLHPQRCKYWKTMVLYHIHSCMSEKLYIFNKHISKVCFVRIQSRGYSNRKPIQRITFLWFGLRETQSYNICLTTFWENWSNLRTALRRIIHENNHARNKHFQLPAFPTANQILWHCSDSQSALRPKSGRNVVSGPISAVAVRENVWERLKLGLISG